MKFAVVTWVDSRVVFSEHDSADIAGLAPAIMRSAGHLVRRDSEVVVLAQDEVQHPGEPLSWRNLLVIPVSAVESVVEVGAD